MSKHFTNIFFAHDTFNHYCSQLIIHTKFEEFFYKWFTKMKVISPFTSSICVVIEDVQ